MGWGVGVLNGNVGVDDTTAAKKQEYWQKSDRKEFHDFVVAVSWRMKRCLILKFNQFSGEGRVGADWETAG